MLPRYLGFDWFVIFPLIIALGLVIPIQQSKNIGDLSYLNFVNNDEENENFNYKRNGLKVNLDLEFNKDATIEVILDSSFRYVRMTNWGRVFNSNRLYYNFIQILFFTFNGI